MTPERLEHARRVVEAVVHEVLDDIVFDKILVTPDLEKYDDDDDLDYMGVRVIYEGEQERLRGRTLKLRYILRMRLLDEGITEWPVMYFTMKSEWDQPPDPAVADREGEISLRRLECARRIAEAVFDEVMDDVVFEKIQVTPDAERFAGDDDLDYLEVRAVYEGEREELRRRTPKLRHLLRQRLLAEGITEYPVLYFTMKSEWDWYPEPA